MTANIKSLQGRLLNIAHEKKLDFQLLVNRLASEQFLYRLSQSRYAKKFIFKGGSLLTYLINSDRKTKDLDFSIKQISNQVEDIIKIIQSILEIPVVDGIEWKKVEGKPLSHPDMRYPGVRLTCRFLFGKMRGIVRMDMAIGDVVNAVMMPLERMQYRGQPIFDKPFSLLVYPPETIFAEKLHIALKKRGQNTRMKDYYDLSSLIDHGLDKKKLKKCIQDVFTNRDMSPITQIQFEESESIRLQVYWEHFLKREKITGAPLQIREIMDRINVYLTTLYES